MQQCAQSCYFQEEHGMNRSGQHHCLQCISASRPLKQDTSKTVLQQDCFWHFSVAAIKSGKIDHMQLLALQAQVTTVEGYKEDVSKSNDATHSYHVYSWQSHLATARAHAIDNGKSKVTGLSGCSRLISLVRLQARGVPAWLLRQSRLGFSLLLGPEKHKKLCVSLHQSTVMACVYQHFWVFNSQLALRGAESKKLT